MELIIPKDYDPRLSIRETQDAIKYIRDTFQKEMGGRCILNVSPLPYSWKRAADLMIT